MSALLVPEADGSGSDRRYLARVKSVLTRSRSLDPRVLDYVLAIGLALLSVGECIAFGSGGGEGVAAAVIGTAGLLSLIVRRRAPLVPLVIVPVATVGAALLDPFFVEQMASPFVGFIAAMYSVGRYDTTRRATLVATAVLLAVTVISAIALVFENPAQVLWLIVLGGGPFVAGRVFANRARLVRDLRAGTVELERDRATRADRAVEDERARIATELQAAVANGVSAMVVQAEAVPRVLAEGDVERAGNALVVIEETGRDALGEMRRLLGVLRRDADDPALAPQPTMAEVERLAERARAEGLEIDLEFEGERVALGAGTDLAAYRVLQEALTAASHGGATSARVLIRFGDDELRLDVHDDRSAGAVDPAPLLAMRERLGLYGGRVKAEALHDGGFRVVARLPMQEVPA